MQLSLNRKLFSCVFQRNRKKDTITYALKLFYTIFSSGKESFAIFLQLRNLKTFLLRNLTSENVTKSNSILLGKSNFCYEI